MAKRTPGEVYAYLRQAGFSPAAAVTETAIAGAESGWNDAAVGDVGLENGTWGPSYGLFQIRTLKAQTGSGTDRDISALSGNDARQAKAAYDISSGGSNFSPWSTYTNGAFQSFLGQAKAAAGSGATIPASTTAATPAGFGPNWLPWNWGSALSDQASSILGGARNLALEGAFAGLGLALLYLGAITLVRPTAKRKEDQLRGAVTGVV